MATFTAPKGTVSAGAAIIADDHNENWTYVKNWLEGVVGNATYPGVIQSDGGGSITGTLDISTSLSSGSLTTTGTVSLGTNAALHLNSTQHDVIGLHTGVSINAETAGNFLVDQHYRAGFTATGPGNNTTELSKDIDVAAPAADAGNYLTEKHRYSVYSKRAGEGYNPGVGVPYPGRPESEYRLVIDGSMAIRGDIIGYTNLNESVPGATPLEYGLGTGTRLNVQWANVRANIDCGGEIRVGSSYPTATLYFGDEYSLNQDYIQWKDNLPTSNLPGFQFVHNDTPHLTIAESAGVLDLRSQSGWPTLPGSAAVINPTSHQLAISSSSIRFKEDVEDLDSEDNWTKLRALKPRTFCWREEVATPGGLDYGNQIPEPGFIAEEVHEVAPDHVLYDAEGDPIVYREKSMLAMLVKAVQDIDNRLGALE